jgi:hypothetical protein
MNIDFSSIKYGVILALIAILFGGSLGLSFGCCEHSLKDYLKHEAASALATKYGGDQAKADKVAKKSWVYYKRAHLHSQTMGAIAIVFSLIVAGLGLAPKIQMGVSILSGFGSLGYGIFWLLSGALAPGMGSTGAAKEAIGLIAQVSGASFFISGVAVFGFVVYKLLLQPTKPFGS